MTVTILSKEFREEIMHTNCAGASPDELLFVVDMEDGTQFLYPIPSISRITIFPKEPTDAHAQ